MEKEEQELWDALGKIKTPTPSKEMKTRFHAMLDTYKNEQEAKNESGLLNGATSRVFDQIKAFFTPKPAFNWAYSLALAMVFGVVGYFVGKPAGGVPQSQQVANQDKVEKLSSEVQEMKQMMMLSMLENPEATERMKAVGYTQELQTVDNQVVEALLTTLNLDPDDNVRLVTLEALLELAKNPKVREGLVLSLSKQDSPMVQVALADAMVKMQEKRSIKQFKQMLNDSNLNKSVKTKIKKTIIALS